MRRTTQLALGVAFHCFLVSLLALPLAAQPVRVTYVFSDGNLPGTLKAYQALLEERPELRSEVSISFLTESLYDRIDPEELVSSDVLVLDTMNQEMVDRFDAEHGVDLLGSVSQRGTVLAVGVGLLPKQHYVERGFEWDQRARAFWEHSGFANQLGLVKLALRAAGVANLDIPRPQPSLDFGYYYPDDSTGQVFATWPEFDQWREQARKTRPGAARVAIGFYKSTYYSGDTELLDAVIAEVERQGAEAVPVFGYPGAVAFERLLIDPEGKPRVDAALAFLFRFANFEASRPLEKLNVPVVSLVSLYGRSEREWRASNAGLSIFEGTFQVAVPELAGLVAPTVVGSQEMVTDPKTGLTISERRPIAGRVSMAVRRALGYAALRKTPNLEKRVALLFYNYPPGRAGIGASYLNVAESLANVLQRLREQGYELGEADLSSESVLAEITEKTYNVGGRAPGELRTMVEAGNAVHVQLDDYQRFMELLAPSLRAKIVADWGPPEETTLMSSREGRRPSLVIPLVRYGNVVVLPQPPRGWGEDNEKLYHAKDLAPHHQYVATYFWLRETFRADAVVHVGTHGTLEWLDGKNLGLSEEDAPDALIDALPNLYAYNVDVVGEGLVARRRGMATLIDHMIPPLKKGGLYPELAKLNERINDHHNAHHQNPELARRYAEQIRELVVVLGIAKDLGLDVDADLPLGHEAVHQIQDHLADLKSQNIPYGLHAFGRTPEKALRDSTIDAVVSIDRGLSESDARELAADLEQRIVESGPRELDSLMRALAGGFVAAGTGGDPVRNPNAYPTGKNFYGIDPEKVPKKAAWELGVELADQMLADHVEEHGAYPKKVSFVIWGAETLRHEGVVESQIFHLLGVRPVWDAREKVIDIQVIPRARLGRPRVDIVVASAAEGMFGNLTRLIDRAVQAVKVLDEAENYVRAQYLKTRAALVELGYSVEDAEARAGVRIFDEPPGTYNLNTSRIAAASGTWDSDAGMANEYLQKMGHGYGNGFWGEPMEDVFRLALAGTEKVVHSNSTMLYGALDNDDMYMYMGGLAAAVRNIDGSSPDLLITNTRNPGKPEMTPMQKFIGTEFRSRYVNPTWIEGMQKEGYAGAGEMRAFVEYLWGWDATVSEMVDDAMWQETFDVYVDDKHDMAMRAFFDDNSPFAFQDMAARMVETIRKRYWDASEATEKRLLEEFIDNVRRFGVGCSGNTCDNPRLLQYVLDRGRELNLPIPALEGFKRAFEESIEQPIAEAAAAVESFVARNEGERVEGFRMTETGQDAPDPEASAGSSAGGPWTGLWAALPLLGLLVVWRARRQRF